MYIMLPNEVYAKIITKRRCYHAAVTDLREFAILDIRLTRMDMRSVKYHT